MVGEDIDKRGDFPQPRRLRLRLIRLLSVKSSNQFGRVTPLCTDKHNEQQPKQRCFPPKVVWLGTWVEGEHQGSLVALLGLLVFVRGSITSFLFDRMSFTSPSVDLYSLSRLLARGVRTAPPPPFFLRRSLPPRCVTTIGSLSIFRILVR